MAQALRQLADFVIERYYPACADAPQPYLALLEQVTRRTAALMPTGRRSASAMA